MTENFITAKVQLNNYRFPRNKVHVSGEYAIVLLNVKEVIEGVIPPSAYTSYGDNTIVMNGQMPRLDRGVDYIVQAKQVTDPKWGIQYKCETIRMDYNLTKREDQEKFFSFFLTPNQIEMLYSIYDNPIPLLKENNIEALTKIKGIGKVTASRMCIKYADNIGNSRAYVALKDLGLTKNAIDALVKQFKSADIVIDLINQNPYDLIKLVRGYGWEKADKLALEQGFARDCKERCLAYARYRLEKEADDGNSCMSIGELIDAVMDICFPVSRENLTEYIKEETVGQTDFDLMYEKILKGDSDVKFPTFFYSAERKKVGLFTYRLLERKIVTELERLDKAESNFKYDRSKCEAIIKEVEEEQGYAYTREQKQAIWNILDSSLSILTGSAGCVDCDTEFFDGKKWKKISEFQQGDKVLIYHENGEATLEEPERYIKEPCEQLWLTKTKYGIDMCLSDEHQVYYITSKGNLYHNTFEHIKKLHENSKQGFSGKMLTTFKPIHCKGINLTNAEIKVMLAVICDGSFYSHYSNPKNICRFHIKKDRKKVELRKIFTEANITWKEKESVAKRYTDFYIYAPRKEKTFTKEWYECSPEQLQLICDNILQWDGTVSGNRMRFSSNNKENADFVQYAFSSCGYRATVSENNRIGKTKITNGKGYERKSIDYSISITKRTLVSMGGFHKDNPSKTKIIPYKTLDGFKYCFTVSTHMWIMRRNGKILITGNCGKSSTIKPLVRIFDYYGLSVSQCALSGRAASLLTEYTGLEGKTIHRLLRYIPDKETFEFTKRNPLPSDVIVLDEVSMVGEDLFLKLIEAIKSGAKLIMLGDIKQLPPIGVGNLLADFMASGYIKTNLLTTIHRQALKSGIVTQSLTVCDGRNLVKSDFSGEQIRGDLLDFKLVCHEDPMVTHMNGINQYKELLKKGIKSEDIQIIVPVRSRGMNSCRMFNNEIQQIVNTTKKSGVTVEVYDNGSKFNVTYKPQDKVLIIKNNYHARTVYGKQVAIFNGNMGYIVEIDESAMIIDLEFVGQIILPRSEWSNITHGWAISAHRSQGSGYPYVIVCVDNSAYTLLTREWLYTAITRAKKYCVVVGQPKAMNTACRTSNVKVKQTWLRGELNQLYLKRFEQ